MKRNCYPAYARTQRAQTWQPRVNIIGNDDHLRLDVQLPGWKKDEVDITVEDGLLTISGKTQNDDDGYTMRRRGFSKRDFSRNFRLGRRMNGEDIGAEFQNGILSITVPYAQTVQQRITIQ